MQGSAHPQEPGTWNFGRTCTLANTPHVTTRDVEPGTLEPWNFPKCMAPKAGAALDMTEACVAQPRGHLSDGALCPAHVLVAHDATGVGMLAAPEFDRTLVLAAWRRPVH